MKYKVIACKVISRELYYIAFNSPNIIDIKLLKQALHNEPVKLRSMLQQAIDEVDNEEETYDAILLGYGLCSNGIVGIESKKYPIVIPRAHDCITLLLGSKEMYRSIFDSFSGGIYWYSPGWIEHSPMPGKERYDNCYKEYLAKYGEDNADYLMKMEQNWLVEYKCALYIDWGFEDNDKYISYTKECARFLNWEFRHERGSSILLKNMLDGNWDKESFLVIRPHATVEPSYDNEIIKEKKKEVIKA